MLTLMRGTAVGLDSVRFHSLQLPGIHSQNTNSTETTINETPEKSGGTAYPCVTTTHSQQRTRREHKNLPEAGKQGCDIVIKAIKIRSTCVSCESAFPVQAPEAPNMCNAGLHFLSQWRSCGRAANTSSKYTKTRGLYSCAALYWEKQKHMARQTSVNVKRG